MHDVLLITIGYADRLEMSCIEVRRSCADESGRGAAIKALVHWPGAVRSDMKADAKRRNFC